MMQLLKWIHINVKIGGEINFPAVQNSGSHVCKNLSILDAECTNVSRVTLQYYYTVIIILMLKARSAWTWFCSFIGRISQQYVIVLSIHLIVWLFGVRWGIVKLADGCNKLLIPVTTPHYEAVGGILAGLAPVHRKW